MSEKHFILKIETAGASLTKIGSVGLSFDVPKELVESVNAFFADNDIKLVLQNQTSDITPINPLIKGEH